jgi:hypothetical protein
MCLLLLQTYHASLMPLGAITKSNSVTTLSKSLTLFYTAACPQDVLDVPTAERIKQLA